MASYPLPAYIDAVGALEILQHTLLDVRDDLSVVSTDLLAWYRQVITGGSADNRTPDRQLEITDHFTFVADLEPRQRNTADVVLAGIVECPFALP